MATDANEQSNIRALFIGLIPVILLVGYFGYLLGKYESDRDVLMKQRELPPDIIAGEAVFVLTGDHERIPLALELVKRRGTNLLVISGTGPGTTLTEIVNQQETEPETTRELWKKILLEDSSTSTLENATEAAKVVRDKHITRVILVTSDYHMPRALRLFRRILPAAVEIYPYPVTPDEMGKGYRHQARIWKQMVEFGKWVIYRHFILPTLAPPA